MKKKKRWLCFYCHKLNEANKRKCIYCNLQKVLPKNKLEQKLDRVFSKFIRKRDNYKCVTCGKAGNEAGHYEKRSHRSTRWDEINVNCQCTACNKYRGGNLANYALFLRRKYGEDILEKIREKRDNYFQPTKHWLLEQIKIYEDKLKEEK